MNTKRFENCTCVQKSWAGARISCNPLRCWWVIVFPGAVFLCTSISLLFIFSPVLSPDYFPKSQRPSTKISAWWLPLKCLKGNAVFSDFVVLWHSASNCWLTVCFLEEEHNRAGMFDLKQHISIHIQNQQQYRPVQFMLFLFCLV